MTGYDEYTKNKMCDGEKKVTRRLYNPERRPGVPGARHKIKIDRTPTVYGEIDILACYPQRFGDMTEEDAKLEGFDSLQEYKEYFYRVNKYIDDDELVWVMEFKLVWACKEGCIYIEE